MNMYTNIHVHVHVHVHDIAKGEPLTMQNLEDLVLGNLVQEWKIPGSSPSV